MRKVKSVLVLLGLLAFVLRSSAQNMVSGKILDESGNPISNVSISYKEVGGAVVLGFTGSKSDGSFEMTINAIDADSLQLDLKHLSYSRKLVVIPNKSANYSYVLSPGNTELKEVRIKEIPVYRRNDTINYHVGSFTNKQDRVIGDIIRKLPGIEMQGDQILYQGKAIQQYRVDGLDLMGSRYGMINQNLPADAVSNVQILENHQPLKILDSLVFSDQATLNLKLKKHTTTGTGNLGLGASPMLLEARVTPMTFARSFQMLNSFQANNIGDDVSGQLRAFDVGGGYLSSRSNFSAGPTFLNIRNVASPGFDQKKWLDNEIYMASTNVLRKLESGTELKGHASYFHDDRKRQGTTATQYFAGEEIIYNQELLDNRYGIDQLSLGFLIERNESDVYFSNSTHYRKHWNRGMGSVLFNQKTPILQDRQFSDEAFLNSFSLARFVGKQLVNIRSTVEWHSTPQQLHVSPGQFEDLLTLGKSYDRMAQLVTYRDFKFENGISFIRTAKAWTFSPSVNLNYNKSRLNTHIELNKDNNPIILGEGYVNNMDNSQLQLALALGIRRQTQKFKYYFNVPFSQFYFSVRQQLVQTMKNELRSTWNPSSNVTYLVDKNNSIGATLSGGRSYGGLGNFYNGYIISQYRSIQRYDARLLKTENIRGMANYEYKNTLNANFINLAYTYDNSWRDYVLNTKLDSVGRSTTSIGDQNSRSRNHGVKAGFSRLFLNINTVVKLSGNMNWRIADYVLNEAIIKQRVHSQSLQMELTNNSLAVISGDYKMAMGRTRNILPGRKGNLLLYNNHFLNLMFAPHERHMVSIANSIYGNNVAGQNSQHFMDATYRYRVKKWNTDLELIALNIFDNRNYLQQFSSDYELVQSYFELRPRQLLISMKFKL